MAIQENFDINGRVADREAYKPIYLLIAEGMTSKEIIYVHVSNSQLLMKLDMVDVSGTLLTKEEVETLRNTPVKNEKIKMNWLIPVHKIHRIENLAKTKTTTV